MIFAFLFRLLVGGVRSTCLVPGAPSSARPAPGLTDKDKCVHLWASSSSRPKSFGEVPRNRADLSRFRRRVFKRAVTCDRRWRTLVHFPHTLQTRGWHRCRRQPTNENVSDPRICSRSSRDWTLLGPSSCSCARFFVAFGIGSCKLEVNQSQTLNGPGWMTAKLQLSALEGVLDAGVWARSSGFAGLETARIP